MSWISSPAHWTDATNLEFLELLASFSSQNACVIPPTPTYSQWVGIISTKHGTLFEIKQLLSRYQHFRKDYMLYTGVKMILV